MNRGKQSISVYLMIYVSLTALTGLTAATAFWSFGSWNSVIALGIATVKAALVMIFFMHIRQLGGLMRIFAFAGIFWLLILLILTFGDYSSRQLDYSKAKSWVIQNASHYFKNKTMQPAA